MLGDVVISIFVIRCVKIFPRIEIISSSREIITIQLRIREKRKTSKISRTLRRNSKFFFRDVSPSFPLAASLEIRQAIFAGGDKVCGSQVDSKPN